MKLNSKIEIDFLDFLKFGTFDYIKIGQTKEWILNNFPNPDDYSFGVENLFSHKCRIWQYGNIEFHFEKDTLNFIFCDDISELNGGENLRLEKWIFRTPEKLNLLYVIEKLNEESIEYEKCNSDESIKLLLKSNVELGFQNYSEKPINPNKFHLNYFALVQGK